MAFIPAVIGAVAGGVGAAGGLLASGVGAAGGLLASGLGSVGAFAGTAGGKALLGFGAQALLSRGSAGAASGGGGNTTYQAPNLPQISSGLVPSESKARAAAEESTLNKRKAISRNRTIFTNPLGLTEEQKSGTTLKTLTGV